MFTPKVKSKQNWLTSTKNPKTEVLTTRTAVPKKRHSAQTARSMHTHGRTRQTPQHFFRFHHFAHKIQTVNRILVSFSPTLS